VKITEDWRKLHYEKFHDLYFSNITVTKSKRKRRVGHVEGRGRTEIHTLLWLENMKKRDALRRPKRRWDGNIKSILTG
jgi:hypothetical protein